MGPISSYCRFINPCFDAKSAAIKIEKCVKIEKLGQALNEGLSVEFGFSAIAARVRDQRLYTAFL